MGNNDRLKYARAQRDDAPPAFWLSTQDVQTHLQERLDMLVSYLRKNDDKYANLESITVSVAGSQASPSFIPLAVILSKDALEIEATNASDEIPSIFMEKDEDGQVQLIPQVEQLFKLFAFSKEDKKLFKSADWLRANNIRKNIGDMIANFSSPKYRKKPGDGPDGDDIDVIMFFIDPIRVFHDMLCGENENPKSFRINIDNIKKIRNGEYRFHVTKRHGKKKNKNRNESFFKEVDMMLRRGN